MVKMVKYNQLLDLSRSDFFHPATCTQSDGSASLLIPLMAATGGVPRGGVPDVGCSGNYSLGNGSSIRFGNTDGSPHYIVSDLNQLW